MSGQTTHLDPEVLAEFRAGLIAGRRGAALAAHLAECDRCAALDTDLTEVSVLLAAAPPPALPADLANRLDIVLAAEVAQRNDYPERAGVTRPRVRRTDGWLARRRGGNRRYRLAALRVLAPAAAVVLAGIGYGLSQIGGPAAPVAAPTGSVRPAIGKAPTSQNPHNVQAEPVERSPGVVVSDTNYLHGTLRQQIETALRKSTPPTSSIAPSQLKECVLRVTHGATLALLQRARYQGQPATVIVVSGTRSDMAWVVGPGCSATSDDILATATLPPGI
jgi:hypothetical protein